MKVEKNAALSSNNDLRNPSQPLRHKRQRLPADGARSVRADASSRIEQSPLVQNGVVSFQQVEQVLEHAPAVCASLGMDPEMLSDADAHRVYEYYLPVFAWAKQRVSNDRPLVVGLSAPQGCGKTTLVSQLELLCERSSINAATLSIDDFYLRGQEQDELAAASPGNQLMQLRGNAGTHDVSLGLQTIKALKAARSTNDEVALPRYDKSLRQGKGDRAPEHTWPRKQGPVDVIFLEGWMLGFSPLGESKAREVDERLVAVDRALQQYDELHSLIDAWMIVQVGSADWVFQWRLQAEHAMREQGKDAMTDEEVRDFVSRFMPAYSAYLPELYDNGPHKASDASKDVLRLRVDETRNLREASNMSG